MNRWLICLPLFLLTFFSRYALAVDPVCDTTWTKSASSWTCDGNGKITFSSNTSFVPAGNLTLIAANGFVLRNNTVGSASIKVEFLSNYGGYSISGSTVYGDLASSSGDFSISSSTIHGTVSSGGNIDLTSSTVVGKVTSSSNTVSATGSNLQGGVQAHSGMDLRSGTVQGALVLTAANSVRLQRMTMTSGSISGASTIHLHSSTIGSPGDRVIVTAATNDIHVQAGTVVYGDLYAAVAYNGTVFVQGRSVVYGECLPQTQPANACNTPPSASVHHYELSYASPGVTCEAEPVTIKACTDAACTTLYSGATAVTLAASNGGSWTNSSPTFSAGSASSALRKTSTGSSVISLTAASPTASNALECKNSGVIDSSCSISFADTGLKIFATDGVSAVPNLVAGVNYTVKLRAIETNTTTGACQARVQGAQSVGVAFRCLNPSTCVSGQTVSQGNVGIGGTAASSSPSYFNVPLTFDSSGTASVPFNYSDVGQIALHAKMDLAASGNNPAITLTAPAATPVVKPYEIRVFAVNLSTGTGANPQTTSSGAGFLPAGSLFRVQLDVLNAAGNRTPNFGRESSPEALNVGFVSLVYPSGGTGNAAYLTNSGSFTAVGSFPGRFQNPQLSWLEAGSFTLRGLLADGDYLGAGDVGLKPASETIGRFYPQHFVLSNVSSGNICSTGNPAFSYLSQPGVPLNFTLDAVNTAGTRLLNYNSSSYSGTAVIGLVAENNGSSHTPDLGSRLTGQPSPTWQQGRYQFSASTLQLARGSGLDGPFLNFQPGIKVLAERDSRNLESNLLTMNATTNASCAVTACDAAPIGNELKFYYGRHRLENAYANAFQAASVVLKAEVWNGSQFVLHSADICSDVKPASLTVTGTPALTVSGSNTKLAGGVNPVNSLLLSAPGQNGSWGLQYQAPVWLKYDWKTNTAGDEDPSATALFGRYRGNDRLIYQREQ